MAPLGKNEGSIGYSPWRVQEESRRRKWETRRVVCGAVHVCVCVCVLGVETHGFLVLEDKGGFVQGVTPLLRLLQGKLLHLLLHLQRGGAHRRDDRVPGGTRVLSCVVRAVVHNVGGHGRLLLLLLRLLHRLLLLLHLYLHLLRLRLHEARRGDNGRSGRRRHRHHLVGLLRRDADRLLPARGNLDGLVLHLGSLGKAAEALRVDHRVVHEHILAARHRLQEAETLLNVPLLHYAAQRLPLRLRRLRHPRLLLLAAGTAAVRVGARGAVLARRLRRRRLPREALQARRRQRRRLLLLLLLRLRSRRRRPPRRQRLHLLVQAEAAAPDALRRGVRRGGSRGAGGSVPVAAGVGAEQGDVGGREHGVHREAEWF
eukprot:Rhum_TRINITY_DN14847_c2_g2::Rhum_TRINITY_DN14847_c2_g2_i1::g.125675::m.125675